MKDVFFHPDAESEMIEAAIYYETLQSNLGKRFLASIQESILHIQLNPNLYTSLEFDVRRCLVKTFPFGIIYRDKPDDIVIVAVMHLHREPDYWKNR
jgi:plasmid stabilization system protein ParE